MENWFYGFLIIVVIIVIILIIITIMQNKQMNKYKNRINILENNNNKQYKNITQPSDEQSDIVRCHKDRDICEANFKALKNIYETTYNNSSIMANLI